MNIKPLKFDEVLAWLERLEISVQNVRRVSINCTNIDLRLGGVLSHYDAGTLVLQGNPPTATIRHFLNLRESVELSNMPTKNVEKRVPKHARFSNWDGFADPALPGGPCDLGCLWNECVEPELGWHDESELDGSGIDVTVDLIGDVAPAGDNSACPHEITSPSASRVFCVPLGVAPASEPKASLDSDW